MLKLLIAEDEALERKALRFLLDKHYSHCMQVVDEVSNGRDAVERSLSLRPDIILMDINMPILNGLEASNMIKKQCENTEIIILTAFNYFDYAKKAINIGVSDYLLKPFSNDEFFHSLDKVIEKADSKVSNETKNQKLKKNYSKVVPYIEKQIIADIVFGVSMTEAQFEEYMEILSIKSTEFCCILFSMDTKGVFCEKSISTIKHKLNIFFQKNIVGLCLNNIVAFVFDESLDSKILGARFKNLLSELSYGLELKTDENLSIGVGSINEGNNKLYFSYKEAKRSTLYEQISTSIKKKDITVDTYNILCGKIINEDLNGAIVEFDNILSPLIIKRDSHNFLLIKESILDMLGIIIENKRIYR
jgi:DNA-binding NarL/FixJ family response regulator